MAVVEPKKITGGAFGRYMAENRAELIKECAGKPATASIKLGSERYKSLSASAKAKYEKMYASAKQQYEKDLAVFLAAGGEKKKQTKKVKKEKKVKDPNRPKKPAGGAFGCFLAKNRSVFTKECAGKPVTAVTKLASERWKSISAAEKQPFEKEYVAKKAAYDKAMKGYVPPAAATNDDEDDEEGEDGDAEGDEEENADEEDDEEEEEEELPKKRTAGGKTDAPAAKKAKTTPSQSDVEADAKKLGYLAKLKTLAENPKVKSSPSDILEMLREQNGSVVATKKALLGA